MYAKKKVKGPPMLVRLLDFFVRLLFKPLSFKFGTAAKRKRTPGLLFSCYVCSVPFKAFNHRQKRCGDKICVKIHRKELYVARKQRLARTFTQHAEEQED